MVESENWLLWLDGDHSPYLNMALDELLWRSAAGLGRPLVRIYGWDRPSASIGYIQKYEAAPQQGYTVVRRPTGGGVVFHDVDLTYTVTAPPQHPICALDRIESYHVFHRAVLRCLALFGLSGQLAADGSGAVDRATMQCFTTPTRYDVICNDIKYAGAAQRRGREGVLHQGSIDLRAAKGDRDGLIRGLVAGFGDEFGIGFDSYLPGQELADAGTLAENKYATDAWNITRTWRESSPAASVEDHNGRPPETQV